MRISGYVLREDFPDLFPLPRSRALGPKLPSYFRVKYQFLMQLIFVDTFPFHFMSEIKLLLIAFPLIEKTFAKFEQLLRSTSESIILRVISRKTRLKKIFSHSSKTASSPMPLAYLKFCNATIKRTGQVTIVICTKVCRRTVFKVLPDNCSGKFFHHMTEETISCNKDLNDSLCWTSL